MKRRELLGQAVAFAAWPSLRDSAAGAAEVNPFAAPQNWPEFGPGPAEARKGDMLYRQFGRTGESISAFGLGGHHIGP